MKILLIAPLQDDANVQNWGAPSLGLMRIDSYLKAMDYGKEFDIEIYDTQIDKFDLHEKYRNISVDILGISVLHYTLLNTLSFIHKWKKNHPETVIVVGGNEASANYQDIFDKSPADVAVLSEGEKTFYDLIMWIKAGFKFKEIPDGIVFRKYSKPIEQNELWEFWKDVDFSKYRYEEYWNESKRLYDNPPIDKTNTVRLVTSSHCNRTCTFCSLAMCRNLASGKKVAPVSLKGWQIMELVHRVRKQLPECKTIYFVTDDVFYPNKQEFFDFIVKYEKANYDFNILCQSSTYSLGEDEFKYLQRLGCTHLTIGVENGSERIRKSLKKPQNENKINAIIEYSKKYGIPVYFLVILMPPESTIEDYVINYYKIKEWISKGVTISIEPICYVYRGTPLFEDDRYDFLWKQKKIEGTKLIYKDSVYVLPKDEQARKLAIEFKKREPEFIKQTFNKLHHKHHFKGETGHILNDLLGTLLIEIGAIDKL